MLSPRKLRPLSYARRHWVPKQSNGKPIAPSTVWRWVKKGIQDSHGNSIKLEAIAVGRTFHTSEEAVTDFFRRLTEARLAQSGNPQSVDTRSDTTQRKLERAGLLTPHSAEAADSQNDTRCRGPL